MQSKHTVVLCLWAKQHNSIHTTSVLQWFQQQRLVVWEGAAKGQEDREVKIIPKARQTYCSVVWAKQHNSIHTAPDSLAVDTLQQQRIVCGMRRCSQEAGGQVNNHQRSQDHDHGKANILWCCVSRQSNTTASALHQLLPLPSVVKKGASDYQIQVRHWPQRSEPSCLYQVKN